MLPRNPSLWVLETYLYIWETKELSLDQALLSGLFQPLEITVNWGRLKPDLFFSLLGHNQANFCGRWQNQNTSLDLLLPIAASIHKGKRKR